MTRGSWRARGSAFASAIKKILDSAAPFSYCTTILTEYTIHMKFSSADIKEKAAALKHKAVSLFNAQVKARVIRLAGMVRTELVEYPNGKERTRRLILLFASLFILDYLMFCLHTDKNVAGIFPEIPSLDNEKQVSIYIPGLDGATITHEPRFIPVYDNDEKTARILFDMVAQGSRYDNTSLAVPVELFVRKVWIYGKGGDAGKVCVFDVEPAELRPDVGPIKNSERLFKSALEKTIKENIPSVKTVMVLEKGVPGATLWEL